MDEPVYESLPCVMTHLDFMDAAERIAHEIEMLSQAETRKKEIAAQITAKVEAHKATVLTLSNMVRSGVEWRDVECRWTLMMTDNRAVLVRCDTGETVRSRRLTEEERQTRILFDESRT